MDKYTEIRPIVIGIVTKDGKTLVSKGIDHKKNQVFYRSLGGGVEFLETLEEALKREFKEELNVEINVKEYLGFIDNIFNYEGRDAHEHVFVYSIDIAGEYKETYTYYEGEIKNEAVWIDIQDAKSGAKKVYPESILKYL